MRLSLAPCSSLSRTLRAAVGGAASGILDSPAPLGGGEGSRAAVRIAGSRGALPLAGRYLNSQFTTSRPTRTMR